MRHLLHLSFSTQRILSINSMQKVVLYKANHTYIRGCYLIVSALLKLYLIKGEEDENNRCH